MDRQPETTNEDVWRMLKIIRQALNENTGRVESCSPIAELEKGIGLLVTSYGTAQEEKDRLEMRNIDLLSREIELNSKCVQYQMEIVEMENTVKEQKRQIQFKNDEVKNIRVILERRIEEENRSSMQRDLTEYELSAKIANNEEILDETETLLAEKEAIVEQLEGSIHQLTEEIFRVNEIIDKQHRELEEREVEIRKISKNSLKVENENKALRSKIYKINEKSEILKRSLEDLENDLIKKQNDNIEENGSSQIREVNVGELQRKVQNFESKFDSIADSLLEFGNENDRLTVRICDILDEVVCEDDSPSDSNIYESNEHTQEAKQQNTNQSILSTGGNNVRKTSDSENMQGHGMLLSKNTNDRKHSNELADGKNNRNATASSKALLEHNNRSKNDKDFGCRLNNYKSANEICDAGNRITFVEGVGERDGGALESLSDRITREQKVEDMDEVNIDVSEDSFGLSEFIEQKTISDLSPAEIRPENNTAIHYNTKETTEQVQTNKNGRNELPAEAKYVGLEEELGHSTPNEANADIKPFCDSDLDESKTNNCKAKETDESNSTIRESNQEIITQSLDSISKDIGGLYLNGEATEKPLQFESLRVSSILEETNVNSLSNKVQQVPHDLVQLVPEAVSNKEDTISCEVKSGSSNNGTELLLTASMNEDDFATAKEEEGGDIVKNKTHSGVDESIEVDGENEELKARITPVSLVEKEEKITSDQVTKEGEFLEAHEGSAVFSVPGHDEEETLKQYEENPEVDVPVVVDNEREAQKPAEVINSPILEVEAATEENELKLQNLALEKPVLPEELEPKIDLTSNVTQEESATPVPTSVSSSILVESQTVPEMPVASNDNQMPVVTEVIPPVLNFSAGKATSKQEEDIQPTGENNIVSEELPLMQTADTQASTPSILETPIVPEMFSPAVEGALEEALLLVEADAPAKETPTALEVSCPAIVVDLEEKTSLAEADLLVADDPDTETSINPEVLSPAIKISSENSSSLSETNVSVADAPVTETPIIPEVYSPPIETASTEVTTTESIPPIELPSISPEDVPSTRIPIASEVLGKDIASNAAVTEDTDIPSNDSPGDDAMGVEPAVTTVSESSVFPSTEVLEEVKMTDTIDEVDPNMPVITVEENSDSEGSELESVSTTSTPVAIHKVCETDSLDSSIEEDTSVHTETGKMRFVKEFEDDVALDAVLFQQGDPSTEPVTMSMRIDSPNRSSVEIPSQLVSGLIKENMQLRKKMEELKNEKSELMDEIANLKSGNTGMKLRHEIDTVVAEKFLLQDQIEALKGIMLDFDEKYKEETAILEKSKEQLEVEIEEMKRKLAEKDDFLLAAKVRENYLMSANEQKRREVADLEASLSVLSSRKDIKGCENCKATEEALDERKREVEDLKAKFSLRQTAPDQDPADQIIPDPSSTDSQEGIDTSYGANNPISTGGANKTQKKKKYMIFCS